MKQLRIFAVSFLLVAPLQGFAAPEPLRLVCSYSETIDAKGQRTSTSGEKLLSVAEAERGRAVITKEGLGAVFHGSISKEVIQGETQYQIQGVMYEETLEINRFTGAFTFTVRTQSSQGLVHHGTCRPASKQLF